MWNNLEFMCKMTMVCMIVVVVGYTIIIIIDCIVLCCYFCRECVAVDGGKCVWTVECLSGRDWDHVWVFGRKSGGGHYRRGGFCRTGWTHGGSQIEGAILASTSHRTDPGGSVPSKPYSRNH
mmetsp:Transcript_29488/g.54036  ORF Transcript_29488/g.54036 Transcript_29488/m.54036 type:complete len:122 (+) Transcript_29488:543-908(+)